VKPVEKIDTEGNTVTLLVATGDDPNVIVDGQRKQVKKGDLFLPAADGYNSVNPKSFKSARSKKDSVGDSSKSTGNK